MSTLRVETSNPAAVEPLAVGAQQLGKPLSLSKRTIHRPDSSGHFPRAVRMGRAKRWLVDEIQEWLRAGAPSREDWERMKRSKEKSDDA